MTGTSLASHPFGREIAEFCSKDDVLSLLPGHGFLDGGCYALGLAIEGYFHSYGITSRLVSAGRPSHYDHVMVEVLLDNAVIYLDAEGMSSREDVLTKSLFALHDGPVVIEPFDPEAADEAGLVAYSEIDVPSRLQRELSDFLGPVDLDRLSLAWVDPDDVTSNHPETPPHPSTTLRESAMPTTLHILSIDSWAEAYKPHSNTIRPNRNAYAGLSGNTSGEGTMYGTTEQELNHVQAIAKTAPGRVWTLSEPTDNYSYPEATDAMLDRVGLRRVPSNWLGEVDDPDEPDYDAESPRTHIVDRDDNPVEREIIIRQGFRPDNATGFFVTDVAADNKLDYMIVNAEAVDLMKALNAPTTPSLNQPDRERTTLSSEPRSPQRSIRSALSGLIGKPKAVAAFLKDHPSLSDSSLTTPLSVALDGVIAWDNWRVISAAHARDSFMFWSVLGGSLRSEYKEYPGLASAVQKTSIPDWSCDIRDVVGLTASKSPLHEFQSLDDLAKQRCSGLISELSRAALDSNMDYRGLRDRRSSSGDRFIVRAWDPHGPRVFLIQDDGSHHFSAARYIAGQIGQDVRLTGTLEIHKLNPKVISAFTDEYRLFILPEKVVYGGFFEAMRVDRVAFGPLPLPQPFAASHSIIALSQEDPRAMRVANMMSEAGVPDMGVAFNAQIAKQRQVEIAFLDELAGSLDAQVPSRPFLNH